MITGAGLSRRTPRRGARRRPTPTLRGVGHLAFTAGIELQELTEEHSDLEQVFLDLTTNGATRTGP